MATESLADSIRGSGDRLAASPGWVDRALNLPERLPGNPPIWWFALFGAMTAVPAGILWLAGTQPVGEVDPRIWLAAFLAAYAVAFRNVVNGIARSAFREFEPALGTGHDTVRLVSDLVSVPDRLAVPAILAIEAVVTIGYFSDRAELEHLLSRPLIEQAVILVTNWISIGLAAVLLTHIVGQLRTVARLHRLATVDLFNAGPAHAFARLTSATAVGILLFALVVLADPVAGRDTLYYAAQAVAYVVLAVAVFGWPLRGMHDRLAAEKAALLAAASDRIKLTLNRIHGEVDSDDLRRSSGLNETLTSLISERDLIGKLSPWPWSTATLRGFASALLLPIVIWAITRFLERLV